MYAVIVDFYRFGCQLSFLTCALVLARSSMAGEYYTCTFNSVSWHLPQQYADLCWVGGGAFGQVSGGWQVEYQCCGGLISVVSIYKSTSILILKADLCISTLLTCHHVKVLNATDALTGAKVAVKKLISPFINHECAKRAYREV